MLLIHVYMLYMSSYCKVLIKNNYEKVLVKSLKSALIFFSDLIKSCKQEQNYGTKNVYLVNVNLLCQPEFCIDSPRLALKALGCRIGGLHWILPCMPAWVKKWEPEFAAKIYHLQPEFSIYSQNLPFAARIYVFAART